MPDITLCTNNTCKIRMTCKRHYIGHKKRVYQSYSEFAPKIKKGRLFCEYFTEQTKPKI